MRRSALLALVIVAAMVFSSPRLTIADWVPNGTSLSMSGYQEFGGVASDGADGFIATWSSAGATFVQRMNDEGNLAPSWSSSGMLVPPVNAYSAHFVVIPLDLVADGEGGAYVLLFAGFPCPAHCANNPGQLYLQRMSSSGEVASGWPVDGVRIAPDVIERPSDLGRVALTANTDHGALVAWSVGSASPRIAVQSVSPNGERRWGENGLTVAHARNEAPAPALVPDGRGGAFVCWADARGSQANVASRIQAQHVSAAGFPLWRGEGIPISLAAYSRVARIEAVGDGAHGALISWSAVDGTDFDLHAARVTSGGGLPWKGDIPLCVAPGDQTELRVIAARHGGLIAAWRDSRRGEDVSIHAQRLSPAGRTMWEEGAVAVCAATGSRGRPSIVDNGSGGAYVAWADDRPAGELYAALLDSEGRLANNWPIDGAVVCQHQPIGFGRFGFVGTLELAPIPGGRAVLVWDDYRDINQHEDVFSLAMLLTPAGPAAIPVHVSKAQPSVIDLRSSTQPPLRIRSEGDGMVLLTLPSDVPATLELFDVAGRKILSRPITMAAGEHRMSLVESVGRVSGLYFARLSQGESVTTARIVFVQ